jgi:hypothetical protein
MATYRKQYQNNIYQTKLSNFKEQIRKDHFDDDLPKFINKYEFVQFIDTKIEQLINDAKLKNEKSIDVTNVVGLIFNSNQIDSNTIHVNNVTYDISTLEIEKLKHRETAKVWKITCAEDTDIAHIKDLFNKNDWKLAKHGDIVIDFNEAGYRSNGVYMISTQSKTKNVVKLGDKEDDYGHVNGETFSVGPKYPIGYWAEADFSPGYWHYSDEPMEPISYDIWSKIKLSKFTYKNGRHALKYKWGTIVFDDDTPDDIVYALDKYKKSNDHGPLYGFYEGDGVLRINGV